MHTENKECIRRSPKSLRSRRPPNEYDHPGFYGRHSVDPRPYRLGLLKSLKENRGVCEIELDPGEDEDFVRELVFDAAQSLRLRIIWDTNEGGKLIGFLNPIQCPHFWNAPWR